MVRLLSKIFIFCLVFVLSFNLYALDFMANKYQGKEAPDFTLSDLSGKDISLKDFQDKAVILFFWTTWCPHCRRQIQILNKEYDNMKSSGIELLAINIDEPKERVEEFMVQYSIGYPMLLDYDGIVASKYQVIGIPTLVFISRDRKISSAYNDLPHNYREIFFD